MGFYGNIADSSHVHFQFDKIFSSRTAMDRACLSGSDGIYAGRFVLVKYDSEIPQEEIKYGYYGIGNNSNILYKDAACTAPYIFTTFSEISSSQTNSENWSSYYNKVQNSNYYVRLKNELEFKEGKDYWIANAADGTNNFNLVTTGTTVYLRDTAQAGSITYICLRCNGGTNGQPATWETVSNSLHYQNYFDNYELDQRTYGDGFNHRGYDATVWQKIYGDNGGKFILIATLNAGQPSFELIPDPPSTEPAAVTIDPTSTEDVYKIRVPTHWGFRIKEVGQNEKSDQIIEQTYPVYTNNIQTGENIRAIRADIYFNKDGFNSTTRGYDDTGRNEILLNPSGQSGKVYYDNNGDIVLKDMYELSVHLPVLGNIVSDFYDKYYGQDRKLDTSWYNINDQQNNITNFNNKTHDLNTIAGLINTFQDRLGQNTMVLNSPLTDNSDLSALDTNYIYIYTAPSGIPTYYRIGYRYDYTPVPEYESVGTLTSDEYEINTYYYYENGEYILASDPYSTYNSNTEFFCKNITYEPVGELLASQYQPGNYYIIKNGEFIGAIQPYNFYPNGQIFYRKNVASKKYQKVSLISYIPGVYYYQEPNTNNYLLDKTPQVPMSYTIPYYSITSENEEPHNFTHGYSVGMFFTEEDGDFIRETAPEPDKTKNYYSLEVSQLEGQINKRLYRPNVYYYYENYINDQPQGQPILDSSSAENYTGFVSSRIYWEIPLIETLTSFYDPQTGKTIVGYELDIAHQQRVNLYSPENVNLENIYAQTDANRYIPISKIDYKIEYSWYMINKGEPITNFFVRGSYYLKTTNGYEIANGEFLGEDYTYYTLKNVKPLQYPFYQANKYHYFDGNIYVLDDQISMSSTPDNYYKSTALYVYSDETQRWPYGFEWPEQAIYVPASVTLATRDKVKYPYELIGVNNGSSSINGQILTLDKIIDTNNNGSRDLTSITGALNSVQDMLASFNLNLIPGRILYVNDFGQIEVSSISISDLEEKILNT